MQKFLTSQGYDVGPVDGKFIEGNVSQKAFQKFLKDNGQDPGPMDGKWGEMTIRAWQKYLVKNKSFCCQTVDGILDAETSLNTQTVPGVVERLRRCSCSWSAEGTT